MNETIARAVFREHRVTLTDAALHSIPRVAAGTTGAYEDVTLVPGEIEFVWHATGRTVVHQCAPMTWGAHVVFTALRLVD